MESWKILASKEIKQIRRLLQEQWGFSGELEYAFLQSAKDNIYIISRDVAKVDWTKLRISSAGLYFGELKNGLRLSIEGSQLVGPHATKNVYDVTSEEAMRWLKGEELKTQATTKGYLIIKHGKDFLGCGAIKEGVILNFVPKIRRLPANA